MVFLFVCFFLNFDLFFSFTVSDRFVVLVNVPLSFEDDTGSQPVGHTFTGVAYDHLKPQMFTL